MDDKQTEKLVRDLVSKLEAQKQFHYNKEIPKKIVYENLSEYEILSLLEEKKEQLRIAVEGLEKYNGNILVNWLKYLGLIIGVILTVSAIVVPLYKGLTSDFYSYLISIAILLLFLLGYLLIDRQIKLGRKTNSLKFRSIKIFEAKELINHVENVLKQYSSTNQNTGTL